MPYDATKKKGGNGNSSHVPHEVTKFDEPDDTSSKTLLI